MSEKISLDSSEIGYEKRLSHNAKTNFSYCVGEGENTIMGKNSKLVFDEIIKRSSISVRWLTRQVEHSVES